MDIIKHRIWGRDKVEETTKVCPDIEVIGSLEVKNTKENVTQARIKFFEDFFSDDNNLPLGRVLVYSNSFPRRYTIVKFDKGDFKERAAYGFGFEEMVPLPLRDYNNNLEEYIRYLYANGVNEVQYFEGMEDDDFQAMIKALFVKKDLTMDELDMIEKKDSGSQYANIPIARIRKGGNALYWYKKDIVPVLTENYLDAFKERYETASDGKINDPDLESLYEYFKKSPNPDMKVLKLEEASSYPFKFV